MATTNELTMLLTPKVSKQGLKEVSEIAEGLKKIEQGAKGLEAKDIELGLEDDEKTIESTTKKLRSLIGTLKQMQKAGQPLRDDKGRFLSIQKTIEALEKLAATIPKTRTEMAKLTKEEEKNAAAALKLENEFRKLAVQEANLATQESKAVASAKKVELQHKKNELQARRLALQEEKLALAQRRQSQAAAAAAAKNGLLSNAFGKLGTVIKGFIAIRLLFFLRQMAVNLIKNAVELEKLRLQFEGFARTAEEAAGDLERVKDVANELGLNFRDLTQGFLRLKAAAKGTSLEGQTLNNVFHAIATTSRAVNLSGEQLKGAFFAVEQIISKNIVSAEELRRQLGDRIPGSFAIMARAIGVTTSELDEMLEKGQLLSEVALPAFAAELEATFSGAAINNAASLNAELGRTQNVLLEIVDAFGMEFNPALTESLQDLRSFGDEGEEAFSSLGRVAGDLTGVIVDLGVALGRLASLDLSGSGVALVEMLAGLDNLVTSFAAKLLKFFVDVKGQIIALFNIGDDSGIEAWIEHQKKLIDQSVEERRKTNQEIVDLENERLNQMRDLGKTEEQLNQESLERQRQLRDEFVKNAQEQGKASAILIRALEGIKDGIDGIKKRNKGVFDPTTEEAKRLKKSLETVIVLSENLGGEISGPLAKALKEMIETFELTEDQIAQIDRVFDDFSKATTSSIRVLNNELQAYINQVTATGPPTKEAADEIVDGIDDILEAIAKLPDKQRESLEDMRKELEGSRKIYLPLTSEAEKAAKKVDKSFKKMAVSAEKSAQKMADAFAKGFGDLAEKIDENTEKAKKKLKELEDFAQGLSPEASFEEFDLGGIKSLQDELETLQEKTNLTSEDLSRIVEIENELNESSHELADAIKQGRLEIEQLESSSDLLEDAMKKLVFESKQFKKGFLGLTDPAQEQIQELLVGLQDTGEQFGLTSEDVKDFLFEVEKVFKSEGLDTSNITEAFTRLGDSQDTASGKLDDFIDQVQKLKGEKEAEKKVLDKNTEALGDTSEAADEAAKKVDELSDSVEDLGEQAGDGGGLTQTSETMAEVGEQAEATAESMEGLGETLIRTKDGYEALESPLQDYRDNLQELGGEVSEVEKKVNSMGDALTDFEGDGPVSLGELKERFIELSRAAGEAGEDLDESAKAFENWIKTSDAGAEIFQKANGEIENLGDAIEIATPKMETLSDVAEEMGLNFDDAVPGFDALTKKLQESGAPIQEAAEDFKVLGDNIEDAKPDAADLDNWNEQAKVLQTTEEAIAATNERLKQLGKNSSGVVPKIDEMTVAVDKAGTHFVEGGNKLDVFVKKEEDLASVTGEVAENADDAAKGAEDLGKKAEGAAEGLAKVPEVARPAAEVIKQVGDAASDAETGVKGVAEGIEKIAGSAQNLKIPDDFNEQLKALGTTSQNFRDAIVAVADGIRKMADSVPDLTVPEGFVEFITALGTAASTNSEAFKKFSDAFQTLAKATAEITAPEGIVDFVTELLAASSQNVEGFKKFSDAFKILSDAMANMEVNDELAGFITEIGEAASAASSGMDEFATAFKKFTDSLAEAELGEVPDQLKAISAALEELVGSELAEGLDALTKSIEKFAEEIGKAEDSAENLLEAVKETVKQLSDLSESLEELKDALGRIESAVDKAVKEIGKLETAADDAEEQVKQLIKELVKMESDAVPAIKAAAAAVSDLAAELRAAASAAAGLTAAMSSIPSPADDSGATLQEPRLDNDNNTGSSLI